MGDSSTAVPRENEESFGFAFNDLDFSDRVLRLEIIQDDESIDSSKNLRGEKYNEWFSSILADRSKDSESYDDAKVKILHITSAILAAKSPFFYKLFKNGMRESQHKNEVSLRINACEEASLMDLLKFMYENNLSATSAPDLIDVLIATDKFEVTSCMRHSIQMLLKLPLSLEHALFYLELPSSLLVSEIVKPLIGATKQYIVAHYRDFTKSQEEAMELSLYAVEVVLGSEGLQVASEDDVYDFILKWARAHYPELEDRREILHKRLAQLIYFPNMSSSKLKEVLVCPDFDHEQLSKLVMEALFSKVELSCGHYIYDSKDLATTKCNLSGRVYSPCFRVYIPRCVVYFDLKKGECADLFPSKRIDSPHFCLSGKWLYLSAYCGQREDRFGLFLNWVQNSETCTLDFEFAVMNKSSNEFQSKLKVNNHTLVDRGLGMRDLLGIPWTDLMSDDSDYFIDGILRLRAEIALANKSQA